MREQRHYVPFALILLPCAFQNPGSSPSTIQLIDQQGRVVREEKTNGGQVELDVRGVSPGSYLVRSGSLVGQAIVE